MCLCLIQQVCNHHRSHTVYDKHTRPNSINEGWQVSAIFSEQLHLKKIQTLEKWPFLWLDIIHLSLNPSVINISYNRKYSVQNTYTLSWFADFTLVTCCEIRFWRPQSIFKLRIGSKKCNHGNPVINYPVCSFFNVNIHRLSLRQRNSFPNGPGTHVVFMTISCNNKSKVINRAVGMLSGKVWHL